MILDQIAADTRLRVEAKKKEISLEEIIYSTNYRNLEIIFSGPYAPNPSELLEQGRFGRLIEETRKVYDYILIGRNDEDGYYFKFGIYRVGDSTVPVCYNLAGYSER